MEAIILFITSALLLLVTILSVIYREQIVYFIVPALFILLLDALASLFIKLFLMFLISASLTISLKDSIIAKLSSSQDVALPKNDDKQD